MTITTSSTTDGATTLSRMNLSAYVGHVTYRVVQWHRNEFESRGTSQERKWAGAPIRREAPEKVFWTCPSTFLAL